MDVEVPNRSQRFKKLVKKNLLTMLLVTGVILAVLVGFIIRIIHEEPCNRRQCSYIGFPGEILIRLLRCTAIPLIVSCVIVATGSLDLTVSKTLGWQLIATVFVTKLLSAGVGLVTVLLIQPGRYTTFNEETSVVMRKTTIPDIFLDVFRNIFPPNMVRMYQQMYQTKLIPPFGKDDADPLTWDISGFYVDELNLLGMIFMATVVGLSLSILQEQGVGLLVIACEVYEVSMKLATWTLWCAPVLLFFLILSEILKIKEFSIFFATWGMFILTVHTGFLAIFLLMHPALLFLLAGVNPFKFYSEMTQALLTAFITASSMAAMPVVMECLLKAKHDKRLVRFVVPIGININKDGSACYLSIGTVFVAQLQGISLSFGQYATIVILAAMGSIAVAGVPFSGVVVFLMILNGVGLDTSYVGGIMAIEWINDRAGSFTNILGNCVVPKMLSQWNKRVLQRSKIRNEAQRAETS